MVVGQVGTTLGRLLCLFGEVVARATAAHEVLGWIPSSDKVVLCFFFNRNLSVAVM